MLKQSNKQASTLSAMLLSFTLALVLIIPSFAVPDVAKAATFRDINRHWAQSYIEKAVGKGLVKGFDDGTFKPDKPVTRAEFATMVNRLLGNTASQSLNFSDVPRSEWFYNDIARALAAAYVGGYNDGKFQPNSPATRQEAAVMISRFLPVSGTSGNIYGFKDSASIQNWSREAVGKVSARGYLKGYDDGAFHPDDAITRAMLAKILCDISEKETIITSNTNVSSNNTILSNKIYSNGVTITSSLGTGNATLSNCVVLGTLTVNGGGQNSVRIENSRVANANIGKSASPVRVVASSNTTIVKSTVNNKSILETSVLSGGIFGKGFENISVERNAESTLRGSFPLVNIDGGKANITVESGNIDKLEASSYATDSTVRVENRARISTANVSARLAFVGDGYIDELNARASGITYAKRPGRVYTSNGASQPTEDTSANLEVQISPKDKETSVSRNRDIELTFKDSIRTSSDKVVTESYIKDNIQIRKDRKTGTKVDFTASISSNKRRITLDPRNSFDDDTTYYVIIDDRQFQYDNGTRIREQVTSFYTGKDSKVGDATFYPKDGATRVSRNVDPTIEFDDPIEFRNGNSMTNSRLRDAIIFRKNNSSGSKVDFTASIDRNNKRITIDPDYRLEDGQRYYLAISSGDFRFTKNSRSVSGASVTWTVGESANGPKVTFDPRDGASNINGTNTDITISFDKSVYRNSSRDSVSESHIKNYISIRHIEGNRTLSYTVRSNNSSRIVIRPNDTLIPGNSYEVTVSAAFYDSDKNVNTTSRARFKVAGTIDLKLLNQAISKAEDERKNVEISNSSDSVFADQFFVNQNVWNTFDTAIKTAINAKSSAISTARADLAATELDKATKIFHDAKQAGTREKINASKLEEAIRDAKAKLAATQKSDDGLDCPKDKKWATPTDYTTFENKIKQEETYLANPKIHTRTDIITHANDLLTATTNFGNENGKQPDKSELVSLISKASKLIDDTELSTDGSNIASGKYYSTEAEQLALSKALDSATVVNNNKKADEATVNDETRKLKEAIDTFESARKLKQ